MSTASGKPALSPARQKFLVDGEQVPPSHKDTFRIRLKVRASCYQVEIGHIGAVTIQQNDFLEAMVGQGLRDVEDMVHEVFEVIIDSSREIDYMTGVTIADGR